MKRLTIISISTLLLTNLIYSQIDTVNVNPTIKTTVDTVAVQEEYYLKGFIAGKADFYNSSFNGEIPNKYTSGLNSVQLTAFSKGYITSYGIEKSWKSFNSCVVTSVVFGTVVVIALWSFQDFEMSL